MDLASLTLPFRNLLRVLAQVLPTALLVAAGGCATTFYPLPLSKPTAASSGQLSVSTPRVAVNVEVLRKETGNDTRLLVVLDLTANEDMLLDLRDSRLLYGSEREQAPIATGSGEPANELAWHQFVFANPLQLKAAQTARAWVVFAGFEGPVAEIPVHMRVRVTPDLEITLSDPGDEPLWQAKQVEVSSGLGGIWVQGSFDQGNVGVAVIDARYVLGPLVLGYRAGVGVQFQPSGATLCCSLPLAADLALPLASGNVVWSPYVGVEAARFNVEADDLNARSFWVGPVLGLQVGFGPLRSRHGPFPIAQLPSVLTASNLRIGLVHWFGDHRPAPDFGLVLNYSLVVAH